MNVSVTTCPGKTLWLASTNSIFTLCSPGGNGYVDCIVVTRIRPQPGQVVDGYVQILGLEDALGQRTGKRWIHNQFGCGLVLDCVVR